MKPFSKDQSDVDDSGQDGDSKSQRKRDMLALQDLGRELAKLNPNRLKSLDLPDEIIHSIQEAVAMSESNAKRRQFQRIGKLLRQVDTIAVKIELQKQKSGVTILQPKRQIDVSADWLKQLFSNTDDSITKLATTYPEIDRQHLRQLARNAITERKKLENGKAAKKLQQYLRQILS